MIFITVGAGFGYWINGVEIRQRETIERMRARLIADRERRAEWQAKENSERERIYAELEQKTQEAAKEES